jgi:prepilin-type N-terminal cleavage/methylation domain-containing protein
MECQTLAPTPWQSQGLSRVSFSRHGFTLVELLVVIAIIGVLAALITVAAKGALDNSNRASIVLEIKNLSGAIENFKNDYGAYPPNLMNPNPSNSPAPNSPAAYAQKDVVTMFKKAFQRSQEPPALILALAGLSSGSSPVTYNGLTNGMTGAEAIYFWLGGFSDDPLHPLSGPGGPSFADPNPGQASTNGEEILEDRKRRYEFDLGRLQPQTDGAVDPTKVRYIEYLVDLNGDGDTSDNGEKRQINFWYYVPPKSEQPLVYFDVSRHKPYQYDMWAVNPTLANAPVIYALKQLRSGLSAPTGNAQDLAFANRGKFQILHCGLDGAWGSTYGVSPFPTSSAPQFVVNGTANNWFLFPSGPFVGDVADTLTNFTDGTLEKAAEQ